MTDFSYIVDTESAPPVGRLAGDIDLASADSLQEAIEATETSGNGGDVVLDMSAVTFLDSSGLRVLVTANDRIGARGDRLVIRSPSSSVSRVLEITGLLTAIAVED